jgi:hypothetical protein
LCQNAWAPTTLSPSTTLQEKKATPLLIFILKNNIFFKHRWQCRIYKVSIEKVSIEKIILLVRATLKVLLFFSSMVAARVLDETKVDI